MDQQNILWHHFECEEVRNMLDTHPDKGLSPEEATRRLNQHGPNILTRKQGKSLFFVFLEQFNQPLVYILLIAAAGVGIMQEWIEMGVILGVVMVNAVIGFVQESKAKKAIASLSETMEMDATVLRGEVKKRIPASELVPGDVVLLQSGDKIPADLRLKTTKDLQVDEAALTGESLPVQKEPGILKANTVLGDRKNMAYSSTFVTYGTGVGIVVETGDNTEIGKINQMISSADILATPLTRKIAKFSHLLLWIILGLAAITIVAGLLRGFSLNDVFIEAVAMAVGAIPEGLPAVVTITLAIGVSRMAQRKAIIRKLPAVETLGSTTVICSDKTGTLTQNEMTVQKIFAGDKTYDVDGTGYEPKGTIFQNDQEILSSDKPALQELLIAGLLCNDSTILKEESQWIVQGDPTEGALISSGKKGGLDPENLNNETPRIDAIPFESEYQYMATLHQKEGGKIAYIKGSVEKLLPVSSHILSDEGKKTDIDREAIRSEVEAFASAGLRVLAFARKEFPEDQQTIDHSDISEGLTFIGLQAMIDPPRPEAIKAIATSHAAGISVKMITGDHVGTATAIAEKLGIIKKGDNQGITGSRLEEMEPEEFQQAACDFSVFARVSPNQKLELVKSLQAEKEIVAMTGDGVNDAPALRQANIGVAMGITGTEVTKETADMILTDDNFASIEASVEEGRGVFDNLMKFIAWTLPTNLTEGGVILIASLLGLTLPLLPLQILWINMTTAVFLGATLAFERKEPGIMERPPYPSDIPILTQRMAFRVIWVSALLIAGVYAVYEYAIHLGASVEVARTAAVNLIVFGEIFYLFNSRSITHSLFKIGFFTNKWLLGGVVIMILLQIGLVYLPFMNNIFGTAPLGLGAWLIILASGFVVFAAVEIAKAIRRWLDHKVLE
jgi:cation-transporting P-type ATPase F